LDTLGSSLTRPICWKCSFHFVNKAEFVVPFLHVHFSFGNSATYLLRNRWRQFSCVTQYEKNVCDFMQAKECPNFHWPIEFFPPIHLFRGKGLCSNYCWVRDAGILSEKWRKKFENKWTYFLGRLIGVVKWSSLLPREQKMVGSNPCVKSF
jgi:hypothetical protein